MEQKKKLIEKSIANMIRLEKEERMAMKMRRARGESAEYNYGIKVLPQPPANQYLKRRRRKT